MKNRANKIPALLSAATLSVAALTLATSSAFALSPGSTAVPISAPLPGNSGNNQDQQQPMLNYNSVTGAVKEINESQSLKGAKIVSLQNDAGEIIANVTVTSNTYVASPDQLKVGAKLTAFYDAKKPMIAIYPPQFEAVVVVPAEEAVTWKVDRFTVDPDRKLGLVSNDKSLIILPSDQTKIILEDGTPFAGSLEGRTLAVKYSIATFSIPPQTTPEQIVVLSEPVQPPVGVMPENEHPKPVSSVDVAGHSIVVEGKTIKTPAAYTDKKGTVMVPLRAIVEALNQKLTWEAATKSTRIGISTSLQIGKDYYVYNKMAPIKLGTSPALVEGATYVPLSFFTDVLRMNNAYAFEGQIVIDNGEKMG
ncbi:copper amine oxidase N-terminal domain-containing protein [Paenibacillus herberti]|uniref:Copper amine oxidase n=1 Tax=Paenibacillus herberti TaxID=1619309 RepID=A0A229NUW8_9BACL|nr:copper amine oxidase N-terminal domain-containing protein [Paenibacillus herberti]OXM13409.1 copper amine oxidase [Paenibacillus herberti]